MHRHMRGFAAYNAGHAVIGVTDLLFFLCLDSILVVLLGDLGLTVF